MKCNRVNQCRVWAAVLLVALHSCCVSSARLRGQLVLPKVTCSARGIKAVFDPLLRDNIHVRDLSGAKVPVPQTEGACGVRVGREKDLSISFFSRHDGCYVQYEGTKVVLPLQVQLTGEDQWFRVNISCPVNKRNAQRTALIPTLLPEKCSADRALRLDCGHQTISSEACHKLGCCYDAHDFTCSYRLNACSLDGHFVFSVKAADTDPPFTPSSLVVKDQPQCFPAISTPDVAVFKIGVMDCGAKMKVDGDVVTYEVEVEEMHSESTVNHSPFSLQVQCEYAPSDLQRAADLRSSYAMTNPPPVVALGTIRVQMRIATDESFTSFLPEDKLPLTLPLREAAYVEVSIAQPSPDPMLSLRVQDCFAYPASRHSVWMLLYDGCPNPLDNMRSSVPVGKRGKTTTTHSQVRRFDVKTFAFLDPQTGYPSVEEIYFYCWVEICTNDADCAQSCAIISSEGERRRRGTASESDQLQLVTFGPLTLGQNKTEVEDRLCVKDNTLFQVTVCIIFGVGAALLLIIVFATVKKCQKKEMPQACDAQVDSEQCQ